MVSFDADWAAACRAHLAGNSREAEACCRRLNAAVPGNLPVLLLLGTILHKAGQYEEASKWLRQATALNPASVGALSRLGSVCMALRDYASAADCFARCVQLQPRCVGAFIELGDACMGLRKHEQAIALYQRAIELEPRNARAWCGLGNAFKETNRIDRAIAAYDRVLEIRPNHEMAHGNRAFVLLVSGRLPEGLRGFEWRWCREGAIAASRPYSQPVWNGEASGQKTLFVHAEQGFGDMIQFVRFIREARRRVARVILECQAPLQRLFAGSDCADRVISVEETPPAFDCYIPIISLARVLGTALETIPNEVPYLIAPQSAGLPAVPAGRLKVGLAWTGNPKNPRDELRSIRLEALAPILQSPGASFFSLQAQVPSRDADCFRSWPNLIDLGGHLKDFQDTAGVIRQVDLVIAVDTAVAHLAGALAKPVWTFIPYSPDWRWLLDRTDTPWYPTMRLFRQQQQGNWQTAIAAAAAELNCLPGGSAAASKLHP